MQMMNIMLWILDMQPVLRRQSVVCLCRSAACMAVVQRRRSPPISTMCAIIARRRQTYNFVWWDLWPQANLKPKMHTAQHTVNVIWESVTKFIISKGTLTHFFPFLRIYFFFITGRSPELYCMIDFSEYFFFPPVVCVRWRSLSHHMLRIRLWIESHMLEAPRRTAVCGKKYRSTIRKWQMLFWSSCPHSGARPMAYHIIIIIANSRMRHKTYFQLPAIWMCNLYRTLYFEFACRPPVHRSPPFCMWVMMEPQKKQESKRNIWCDVGLCQPPHYYIQTLMGFFVFFWVCYFCGRWFLTASESA